MTDHLQNFIAHMRSVGCGPARESDVKEAWGRYIDREGDKRGTKKISYGIKIEGNFASGYVRDQKMGETFKWSSGSSKEWSSEEKAAWKKRRADAEREAEEALASRYMVMAKRAAEIWGGASKADKHPYLTKKGLSGIGAKYASEVTFETEDGTKRQYKNVLLVPLYKDGAVVNLQFIFQDGTKIPMDGAEITGCYGSVNKSRDMSVIYIAEGYATAHSVWDATEQPCIYAWNAGNLKAVAAVIRKKYPDAKIIIAADNDQWTEVRGKPFNVGVEKAKQAAVSVGGFVIAPDFPADDEQRGTDWNDFLLRYGKDEARIKLQAAGVNAELGAGTPLDAAHTDEQSPPSYLMDGPPIEAYEYYSSVEVAQAGNDWKHLLIANDEGKLKPSSVKNAMLILHHHEDYHGIFRYNRFCHQIMVMRCPKWEDASKFKAHRLEDVDITQAAASLESFGLSPDTARVHKAIEVVANLNTFHPAQEYFDGLQWDGIGRLDKWLSYYMGAEDDDPAYLAFAGKKWLTAAVKRTYQPGCKFDHVLVMEGKQGRGKSTALKVLATFGEIEESYFTDAITIADLQNKDTIQKLQGSIIVELAELAGFNKKEDEEIKRWITIQHDDCRLPYARTTTRFNRQFVLAATTNSYDYLKDPTGNRRYWPVKTGTIDLEALKKDRAQLWAEAVHYYKTGLYIGPSDEEMVMAAVAQHKRMAVDAWEQDVLRVINDNLLGRVGFKTEDVMAEMGMALRDRDWRAQRRVAGILQANGYENEIKWYEGKSQRLWVKP